MRLGCLIQLSANADSNTSMDKLMAQFEHAHRILIHIQPETDKHKRNEKKKTFPFSV